MQNLFCIKNGFLRGPNLLTTFRRAINDYASYIIITIVALVTRFINIGNPRGFVMDEFYYVSDAASLLRHGYEADYLDKIGSHPEQLEYAKNFLSGVLPQTTLEYSASHPPFGKMLIALGMLPFEYTNTVGWRLSAIVAGVIMVILTMMLAKKIFNNKVVTTLSGLFVALDPMGVAMSRTSHLDIFLATLTLGSLYLFFVYIKENKPVRYLYFSIMLAALALSVKWSAIFYIAAIVIYYIYNQIRNKQKLGTLTLRLVNMGGIGILTYLATWSSYIYFYLIQFKQVALTDTLSELVKHHIGTYKALAGISAPHNYNSNAFEWALASRPTLLYRVFYEDGTVAAVASMPNPITWYLGMSAVLVIAFLTALVLFRKIRQQEVRNYGISNTWPIALLLISAWLPWTLYYGRTIFQFYSILFLPAIMILAAWLINKMFKISFLKGKVSLGRMIILVWFVLSAYLMTVATGIITNQTTSGYALYTQWLSIHQDLGTWDSSQSNFDDSTETTLNSLTPAAPIISK
jgi:dolichyl-phosphate-mannose-protein mannosyltransferase